MRRISLTGTGGGPSTARPWTEMDERFLIILGKDFGQGLAGIRVEPFAQVSKLF